MKLLTVFRYRRWILAGAVGLALSCGARNALLTPVSAASTNAAPAPTGMASPETDSDTGKPIVTTPSGLKYVDITPGTGAAVKMGDHPSVNYEGKLTDGKKFDSSYDRGEPFDLILGVSQVIPGWTEGLSTMKVGGVRKLIIPPQLGYGQEGMGDVIPPNATLIFKVEIVADKPGQ